MSTKEIPLSFTTPRYNVLVELDGRDYLLDLAYNPRGEYFAMTIKSANGELLAAGQKLAGNAPMLRLFDSDALPPGQFWVDARGNAGEDPDRATLGSSVFLLYEEAASA